MHATLSPSIPLLVVVTLATAAGAPVASAQLKLPQESPAATLSLDVGVTTISLAYHRPALRGRDPWRELGDVKGTQGVWRLGANEATTIAFTDPVTIAGKSVPAGTYALLAVVGETQWTLILNKSAQQWGAYFYDAKQDQLRFDVKVERVPKEARREWFTLALDPIGESDAQVTIAWADARLAFPIHVDVDAIVDARIERALMERAPKDWKTPLQVAQYWCKRKTRLEKALDLVDDALEIEQNAWTCEWKARILHELGDDDPALPLLEKALELAKDPSFPEGYRQGLRASLAEWKGKRN